MRTAVLGAVCILLLALPGLAASTVTQQPIDSEGTWSPRYERFLEAATDGALIPGLKQGFVPQGIGYVEDQDWFLMGGYRDGHSSLVSVVDAATGAHVKSVQFAMRDGGFYRGHAGGLAISEKHLWISSGEQVHFIELEEIIAAEHGDTLLFSGHTPVDSRGSFVSYAEGVLWVGDFALTPGYPTEPHHHMTNRVGEQHLGWMAGYVLDEQTDLIREDHGTNHKGAYIPDLVLSIPNKIQEGTVFGDKIILTESYGRNNIGQLFIYDNPLTGPPHAHAEFEQHSVPVWFLDRENELDRWALTPMAESIVERNGKFHIIFESAALKYLDGSATYPLDHVQVIDVDVLFDSL